MLRQKSFENDKATLYLVPTPIGNLQEMTPRAIEVLKSVDVIACEDTRNSGMLLKHFDIHQKLIVYENFNESVASKGIVNVLSEGKDVALISDAGYPLINDPGQRVVMDAVEEGYNVVPLSGCNAMLNALVASGLIAQPFLFIGFLPAGKNDCIKRLEDLKDYPMTMIFYEAPHRITKMLQSCREVLGNRKMCLARELTKLHEEFIRGTIDEVIEISDTLKGEMVVVIEGCPEKEAAIDEGTLLLMVNEKMEAGLTRSEAIKAIAKATGYSKNDLYQLVHKN